MVDPGSIECAGTDRVVSGLLQRALGWWQHGNADAFAKLLTDVNEMREREEGEDIVRVGIWFKNM